MFTFRRCDNCGKINPKRLNNNDRLCGEDGCAIEGGFYREKGETIGANGKVGWWTLRFPFTISWRGWWTLASWRKK